ncbi:conserved Plasmodium protein, unknown function [Plasmodium berghei]|uniref:Uncharacterized protein n=2 Tax=Plasmodium berghei TaxID=5821 RepID=A0A509AHE6_PLABA|nr:conserved Plasmodium protein, unknown function [Plasmodium berghei ANKA]CXI32405.1 conserved Plasmodium protein, unknown function [Plasmodium berghei]SCM21129.1 conserved Plasmodium protein, unknown function [Plasmodium berghei]SCN24480.1 conserved Plasmodium protein, unknown function [Plasmodium berghei]SCO59663.1 conserved Plasmodium protein, unknown function [Plasmodium berghei]SCO60843.1 conserved Plasmodium protein, unknown function [Plasmodium berghei]|eukprot:XP_034421138.1 conserved Plasmodium protein, unknown function [Plasmodium berghei ANKA]
MMKFTRARKKYRIENPYDEKHKLEILDEKNDKVQKIKKIKNKEENHSKNNETQINKAEQFMKIYKRYMEQNHDFEKVQKENEYIKETKDKTVRRKKIKKLNIKLRKNNLIEKIIKNKAFMVAKERISIRPKEKEKTKKNNTNNYNKTPSTTFNENSKKIQKLIIKSNNDIKTNNIAQKNNTQTTNNNKSKKNRIEIINKYDEIMNSNKFLQNPLEFAKNALDQKKKPNTLSKQS